MYKIVNILDSNYAYSIGAMGFTTIIPTCYSSLDHSDRYYKVVPVYKKLCFMTNKCISCKEHCYRLLKEASVSNV